MATSQMRRNQQKTGNVRFIDVHYILYPICNVVVSSVSSGPGHTDTVFIIC